jgi:YhcH/YjgK/YiaL family protein
MIVDTLTNISIYKNISQDIFLGLEFIKNAKPDIEVGTYEISSKVKAIVSEYMTKENFERGYEAHKRVIDIQYPIRGTERVKWAPISQMHVNIPYDEKKDVMYYTKGAKNVSHIDIGEGIFAIMFPEDGHSPQHFVYSPEFIKKITMKISI